MGKGDKKSKRGKITMGSYGVRRPRKKTKKIVVGKTKKETVKKAVTEVVATPEKKVSKAKTTKKKEKEA